MKLAAYPRVLGNSVIAIALLFGGWCADAQYAPQTTGRVHAALPDEAAAEFLLVDCSGRFFKVRKRQPNFVAEGSLPFAGHNGNGSSRHDGCLVEDVQYLRRQSTLIAIVALDPQLDPVGKRRYSVTTFDSLGLERRGSLDLGPQVQAPRLLVSPSGGTVHVLYSLSRAGRVLAKIDRLDLASMRAVLSREFDEANSSRLLAATAVQINDDGAILIDSLPLERVSGTGVDTQGFREVVAFWNLRIKGGASEITGEGAKPSFARAASAGGIAAYIAGWDMRTAPNSRGVIIAYDLIGRAVVGGFQTPFRLAPFDGTTGTPNVHLSPTGTTAIIEPYEWAKSDSGSASRARTGQLVAYDVRSGTLLGSLQLPVARAWSGRFLGFADGGRAMLYAQDGKFFAIEVTSMTLNWALDLPTGFEPVAWLALK